MRKYLVINFNSRIYVPLASNIADLGNPVYELVLDFNFNPEQNMKLIANTVTIFKPQIILSFGWWQGRIDIGKYEEIVTGSGAVHIYWTYDDPVYLDWLSVPMLKFTQLIFTTDGDCVPWYNRQGRMAAFLPFACDPRQHKKIESHPQYKNDIVLLANNYNQKHHAPLPNRIKGITDVLQPLLNGYYDVKVYGLWWQDESRLFNLDPQYYGGVVAPETISNVYSSAKIALGLLSIATSTNMLSMRVFEALGCGILYLTQYSRALEYFFRNEEHLLWSNSAEETQSYINFYLHNDTLREKIAQQGQEFVYQNHTYAHRARDLTMIIEREFKLG